MTLALTIDDPRYFDRLAQVESAHWWSQAMWRLAENWLSRAVRGRRHLHALDAGCGTGLTAERLAQRPEFDSVVGVDASKEALARAQRYDRAWARATVLALPFADRSFDVVTCFDVLQHVPWSHDRRAVCELARVLRPGGVLLIRSNGRGWQRARSAVPPYRLDEITGLIASAGLRVRRWSYANCLPALAQDVRAHFSRGRPGQAAGGGLTIRLRSPWVNRLMASLSTLETGWAGPLGARLPFGHSTLVLAERERSAATEGGPA